MIVQLILSKLESITGGGKSSKIMLKATGNQVLQLREELAMNAAPSESVPIPLAPALDSVGFVTNSSFNIVQINLCAS